LSAENLALSVERRAQRGRERGRESVERRAQGAERERGRERGRESVERRAQRGREGERTAGRKPGEAEFY